MYVIIGSGLAGMSTAYWLLENGIKEITIIDKNDDFAASKLNAGFLTAGSLVHYNFLIERFGDNKGNLLWRIAKENIFLISKFIEDNNLEANLKKNGSYSIVDKKPGRICSDFKELSKFKDYFTYYDSTEMSVEPRLLWGSFKSYLKNRNVSFVKKEIKDLKEVHDEFHPKHVFINTNSSDLFGHKINIVRNRAQVCKFKINTKLLNGNYYFSSRKIYFRINDNEVVIGGARYIDEDIERTNSLGINDKIQSELQKFVIQYVDDKPVLIECWSGIMGFSDTFLPKIRIVEDEKCSFLGGFSGHGNGYAYILSKYIVEKILKNKENTNLNLFN